MKSAWFTLLVSAFTDFMITAGTTFLALPPESEITKRQVIAILIGGGVAFARTISQKLNTSQETVSNLKGQSSITQTTTLSNGN